MLLVTCFAVFLAPAMPVPSATEVDSSVWVAQAKKPKKAKRRGDQPARNTSPSATPADPDVPLPAAETPAAAKPAEAKPSGATSPAEVQDLESIMATSQGAAAQVGANTGLAQAARVAVYDFELQNVDTNIGQVVTDSVLAEVRKLSSISAIGMDEIRDMLSHEANKQYLGCEENESCLAEIAGALGVDELVSGKLSKVDEGTVFLMRRIDQRRAKVLGVVTKRLSGGTGEEFLAAIGPAVEELFAERQLRAGLSRGVPKEMALRLNPPPLPSWSTLTVGGGAVVALAMGGVFGLLMNDAKADFDSYVETGKTAEIEGRLLVEKQDRVRSRASTANMLFIGAGALGLAAGIMALFTDWNDYAGQASVQAR